VKFVKTKSEGRKIKRKLQVIIADDSDVACFKEEKVIFLKQKRGIREEEKSVTFYTSIKSQV
jgi:hypothetical protein